MKVSKLLRRLSPLLIVFCYVLFTSDECGWLDSDYDEGTGKYVKIEGSLYRLVSSKWYTGTGNEVILNMWGLVTEGNGGFSVGERSVQWINSVAESEFDNQVILKSDYWGKTNSRGPYVPCSNMRIHMKTWDLKELPDGTREEPYPIADFDMDYAYYLGNSLKVEDDGKTIILRIEATGAYMMFVREGDVKVGATPREKSR